MRIFFLILIFALPSIANAYDFNNPMFVYNLCFPYWVERTAAEIAFYITSLLSALFYSNSLGIFIAFYVWQLAKMAIINSAEFSFEKIFEMIYQSPVNNIFTKILLYYFALNSFLAPTGIKIYSYKIEPASNGINGDLDFTFEQVPPLLTKAQLFGSMNGIKNLTSLKDLNLNTEISTGGYVLIAPLITVIPAAVFSRYVYGLQQKANPSIQPEPQSLIRMPIFDKFFRAVIHNPGEATNKMYGSLTALNPARDLAVIPSYLTNYNMATFTQIANLRSSNKQRLTLMEKKFLDFRLSIVNSILNYVTRENVDSEGALDTPEGQAFAAGIFGLYTGSFRLANKGDFDDDDNFDAYWVPNAAAAQERALLQPFLAYGINNQIDEALAYRTKKGGGDVNVAGSKSIDLQTRFAFSQFLMSLGEQPYFFNSPVPSEMTKLSISHTANTIKDSTVIIAGVEVAIPRPTAFVAALADDYIRDNGVPTFESDIVKASDSYEKWRSSKTNGVDKGVFDPTPVEIDTRNPSISRWLYQMSSSPMYATFSQAVVDQLREFNSGYYSDPINIPERFKSDGSLFAKYFYTGGKLHHAFNTIGSGTSFDQDTKKFFAVRANVVPNDWYLEVRAALMLTVLNDWLDRYYDKATALSNNALSDGAKWKSGDTMNGPLVFTSTDNADYTEYTSTSPNTDMAELVHKIFKEPTTNILWLSHMAHKQIDNVLYFSKLVSDHAKLSYMKVGENATEYSNPCYKAPRYSANQRKALLSVSDSGFKELYNFSEQVYKRFSNIFRRFKGDANFSSTLFDSTSAPVPSLNPEIPLNVQKLIPHTEPTLDIPLSGSCSYKNNSGTLVKVSKTVSLIRKEDSYFLTDALAREIKETATEEFDTFLTQTNAAANSGAMETSSTFVLFKDALASHHFNYFLHSMSANDEFMKIAKGSTALDTEYYNFISSVYTNLLNLTADGTSLPLLFSKSILTDTDDSLKEYLDNITTELSKPQGNVFDVPLLLPKLGLDSDFTQNLYDQIFGLEPLSPHVTNLTLWSITTYILQISDFIYGIAFSGKFADQGGLGFINDMLGKNTKKQNETKLDEGSAVVDDCATIAVWHIDALAALKCRMSKSDKTISSISDGVYAMAGSDGEDHGAGFWEKWGVIILGIVANFVYNGAILTTVWIIVNFFLGTLFLFSKRLIISIIEWSVVVPYLFMEANTSPTSNFKEVIGKSIATLKNPLVFMSTSLLLGLLMMGFTIVFQVLLHLVFMFWTSYPNNPVTMIVYVLAVRLLFGKGIDSLKKVIDEQYNDKQDSSLVGQVKGGVNKATEFVSTRAVSIKQSFGLPKPKDPSPKGPPPPKDPQ